MSCSRLTRRRTGRGFTLVEVLIVLFILAVLAVVALPKYLDYQERIRVNQAITEIRAMNALLRAYMIDNTTPPDDLAASVRANTLDPWGRPYQYLKLQGASKAWPARRARTRAWYPSIPTSTCTAWARTAKPRDR